MRVTTFRHISAIPLVVALLIAGTVSLARPNARVHAAPAFTVTLTKANFGVQHLDVVKNDFSDPTNARFTLENGSELWYSFVEKTSDGAVKTTPVDPLHDIISYTAGLANQLPPNNVIPINLITGQLNYTQVKLATHFTGPGQTVQITMNPYTVPAIALDAIRLIIQFLGLDSPNILTGLLDPDVLQAVQEAVSSIQHFGDLVNDLLKAYSDLHNLQALAVDGTKCAKAIVDIFSTPAAKLALEALIFKVLAKVLSSDVIAAALLSIGEEISGVIGVAKFVIAAAGFVADFVLAIGSQLGTHGMPTVTLASVGAPTTTPTSQVIYITTNNETVYAVNRVTGTEMWNVQAPSSTHFVGIEHDEVLYVHFGPRMGFASPEVDTLYGIDAHTKRSWMVENIIYLGHQAGKVFVIRNTQQDTAALDVATSQVVWAKQDVGFDFTIGNNVAYTTNFRDNTGTNLDVDAYALDTGNLLWKSMLAGSISPHSVGTVMGIGKEAVYVSSAPLDSNSPNYKGRFIEAFDIHNGNRLWSQEYLNFTEYAGVYEAGNILYLDEAQIILDRITGEIKWTLDYSRYDNKCNASDVTAISQPLIIESAVYASCQDSMNQPANDTLSSFNIADGSLLWQVPFIGNNIVFAGIEGQTLFLEADLSNGRTLFAFATDNKRIIWQHLGQFELIDANYVYHTIDNTNKAVSAFDILTDKPQWSAPFIGDGSGIASVTLPS